MKTWVVLFLFVLAVGVAWGLARDLFSRAKGTIDGTVVSVDLGTPLPKWFPPTPPHYKVRIPSGQIVTVAAKNPVNLRTGAGISITEWVTPWGQVWYTQRD